MIHIYWKRKWNEGHFCVIIKSSKLLFLFTRNVFVVGKRYVTTQTRGDPLFPRQKKKRFQIGNETSFSRHLFSVFHHLWIRICRPTGKNKSIISMSDVYCCNITKKLNSWPLWYCTRESVTMLCSATMSSPTESGAVSFTSAPEVRDCIPRTTNRKRNE